MSSDHHSAGAGKARRALQTTEAGAGATATAGRAAADWRHDAWDALRAPVVGAQLLLSRRRLWAPAALPVFLGLIWSLLSLSYASASAASGPFWIVAAAFTLAAFLLLGIVFVQLLLAFCAPLFDWLSERTEAELTAGGLPAEGSDGWLRRSLRAAGVGFRLLALKLLLLLVVVVVSFMPPLGPLLGWLLIGFTLSIDFLDYPMTRRGWSGRHKRAWLGRHWAAVVVFSALIYALLILPGLGGLMVAPAIIGGTWLACTRDRTPYARPSPPGPTSPGPDRSEPTRASRSGPN